MNMYRVGLFAASLLLIIASSLQGQRRSTDRPAGSAEYLVQSPASPGYQPSVPQLGLQFGSGVLVGAAGGALSGLAGMTLFAPDKGNSASGFANMGAFVLGGTLGYTVSSALGIYIIADNPRSEASFGSILLGSTAGTVAGLGTLALLGSDSAATGIAIALATPVIGGIVANGLSADPQTSPAMTSGLLNLSDGDATLATPAVQVRQVGNPRLKTSISYSPTLKLLNISL